ncbi:unnamed protein product [Lactuca saligna]|uniref:Uncharacterized protein n=1 Tax=Lactuca saligna TaxID=75948 RepID=A0AA35ZDC6_LACSI|nr:unnamed protein product [Lactuca saligna]
MYSTYRLKKLLFHPSFTLSSLHCCRRQISSSLLAVASYSTTLSASTLKRRTRSDKKFDEESFHQFGDTESHIPVMLEFVPDRFRLTEEEVSRVKHVVSELLRKETYVKDLDNNNVHAVVQQVVNIIEAAAGELECLSVVVASKLQKFFLFDNIDVEGRSNSSTIFSRLSSHAEEDVRKQHEGILVMLAKQSPWSIIYPTLVDVNTSEEDHSMELT